MADEQQTSETGTASNVNAAGAGAGNDLAQAIANAVAAGVSTSLDQVTAKLNQLAQSINESISQNTKKLSTSDDTNFETSVTGVHDPFESLRRADIARDRVMVYAEQALANCVELAHRCGLQGLDHNAALPPIAPRSPTGPGTAAG